MSKEKLEMLLEEASDSIDSNTTLANASQEMVDENVNRSIDCIDFESLATADVQKLLNLLQDKQTFSRVTTLLNSLLDKSQSGRLTPTDLSRIAFLQKLQRIIESDWITKMAEDIWKIEQETLHPKHTMFADFLKQLADTRVLVFIDGDQASHTLPKLSTLIDRITDGKKKNSPIRVIVGVADSSRSSHIKPYLNESWLHLFQPNSAAKDAVDILICCKMVEYALAMRNKKNICFIVVTSDHFGTALCNEMNTAERPAFVVRREEQLDTAVLLLAKNQLSSLDNAKIKQCYQELNKLFTHTIKYNRANLYQSAFIITLGNHGYLPGVFQKKYLCRLAEHLLGTKEDFMDELKKYLIMSKNSEGIQVSWIGNQFPFKTANWIDFLSRHAVELYLCASLARLPTGSIVLRPWSFNGVIPKIEPAPMLEKQGSIVLSKELPINWDNLTTSEFRSLYKDHHTKAFNSHREFCKKYKLDTSNFNKWRQGKKESNKINSAVTEFLKTLILDDDLQLITSSKNANPTIHSLNQQKLCSDTSMANVDNTLSIAKFGSENFNIVLPDTENLNDSNSNTLRNCKHENSEQIEPILTTPIETFNNNIYETGTLNSEMDNKEKNELAIIAEMKTPADLPENELVIIPEINTPHDLTESEQIIEILQIFNAYVLQTRPATEAIFEIEKEQAVQLVGACEPKKISTEPLAFVFIDGDQANHTVPRLAEFIDRITNGGKTASPIRAIVGISNKSSSSFLTTYLSQPWLHVFPPKSAARDAVDIALTCRAMLYRSVQAQQENLCFFIVTNDHFGVALTQEIDRLHHPAFLVRRDEELDTAVQLLCKSLPSFNEESMKCYKELQQRIEALDLSNLDLPRNNSLVTTIGNHGQLPAELQKKYLFNLAKHLLGTEEDFLDKLKAKVEGEGQIVAAWIGNQFSSKNARWIDFLSRHAVQLYLCAKLGRSITGSVVLRSWNFQPKRLEDAVKPPPLPVINSTYKNFLWEHVPEKELIRLYEKYYAKPINSYAEFCRKYNLDRSNFNKWRQGTKPSNKIKKAVIEFLKTVELDEAEQAQQTDIQRNQLAFNLCYNNPTYNLVYPQIGTSTDLNHNLNCNNTDFSHNQSYHQHNTPFYTQPYQNYTQFSDTHTPFYHQHNTPFYPQPYQYYTQFQQGTDYSPLSNNNFAQFPRQSEQKKRKPDNEASNLQQKSAKKSKKSLYEISFFPPSSTSKPGFKVEKQENPEPKNK